MMIHKRLESDEGRIKLIEFSNMKDIGGFAESNFNWIVRVETKFQ